MLPAGKYYVGDLCYVMSPQWDEVCSTIFGDLDSTGEFQLENGIRFASHSTYAGDGNYKDLSGREYPVDAGLIGCIRLEDINDKEADLEGGNIIDFPAPFETSYNDGLIVIGHIEIDTKGLEEDENDSDYHNDYDEDDEDYKYT